MTILQQAVLAILQAVLAILQLCVLIYMIWDYFAEKRRQKKAEAEKILALLAKEHEPKRTWTKGSNSGLGTWM